MRGSRIPHPPGGRLVKVWRWAVDAVGRSAATVLAELEWRDRLHDEPGRPVATRAELVSSLEGFVSRNHVDEALHTLVGLGWVRRHERTTLGERNLRTWHEFSLDADAVAKFLTGDPENEKPASLNGDSGNSETGTEPGTGLGIPHMVHNDSKPPPPPPVPLDDLVEAAVWAHTRPLVNESGFRWAVRERLQSKGPNPEDLRTLESWRSSRGKIKPSQCASGSDPAKLAASAERVHREMERARQGAA